MTTADWSVLQLPDVDRVARAAAAKTAATFESVTEVDDLYQEAMILLAVNAGRVRTYLDSGQPSHLHQWLADRLFNTVRTAQNRANRHVSFDALYEYCDRRADGFDE